MQNAIDADRLVLGTAQLGLDYGVANMTGKPDLDGAFLLLDAMWQAGVRWFDTASAYGDSEFVLGRFLEGKPQREEARIVTKLPPDLTSNDAVGFVQGARASLEQTGARCLAGLMLHDDTLLDAWATCRKSVESLKEAGVVARVGVSVNSPQRALQALRLDGIDVLQVPANILDHRFHRHGVFDATAEAGKDVFIRSVYLQGLFFASPESFAHRRARLGFLDRERALYWTGQVKSLAAEAGIPTDHLALAYVKRAYPQAKVLLGMETLKQARRNIEAWNALLPDWVVETAAERFASVEDEIVHPPYWRRGRFD